MPRVTKTPVHHAPRVHGAGGSAAQQAEEQAAAAYNPQIHATRAQLHGEVGSLNTMGSALEKQLAIARHNIRGAGLQGDDRALALQDLAYRGADVAAGTQLQIQQARQDAHGEIQSLVQQRGAAASSALAEARKAEQERAQDLADHAQEQAQDYKWNILEAITKDKLGLDGSGEGGGLTPTQKRDAAQSQQAAHFYASQAFKALRGSGKVAEDPREWDQSTWEALTGAVAKQKGVDNIEDAEKSVQAIADHFGHSGEGFNDVLGVLGKGALTAAPLLLQMLAANGGHRRG